MGKHRSTKLQQLLSEPFAELILGSELWIELKLEDNPRAFSEFKNPDFD